MSEALAPIRFGTDGWRAIIAREFTFANLERVAQAYADYLRKTEEALLLRQPVAVGQVSREEAETQMFRNVVNKALVGHSVLVVIGYDRRFLSEQFAQRVAEVMVGNGFRIALFQEAAPTPLVSWAVKELGASGGIVLTASHNPPDFNGFKIKAPWAEARRRKRQREWKSWLMPTRPNAVLFLLMAANYLSRQSRVIANRWLPI